MRYLGNAGHETFMAIVPWAAVMCVLMFTVVLIASSVAMLSETLNGRDFGKLLSAATGVAGAGGGLIGLKRLWRTAP